MNEVSERAPADDFDMGLDRAKKALIIMTISFLIFVIGLVTLILWGAIALLRFYGVI